MMKWNRKIAKRVIERLGGEQLYCLGVDGIIRNRPAEIRPLREDGKYKIFRAAHKRMYDMKGYYIFVNEQYHARIVPAKIVSMLLGMSRWLSNGNNKYQFKWIQEKQIFNPYE